MLSDLRESGCLTAETRLMRADTNTEITLGELMACGVIATSRSGRWTIGSSWCHAR